jgi:hypothetical protein
MGLCPWLARRQRHSQRPRRGRTAQCGRRGWCTPRAAGRGPCRERRRTANRECAWRCPRRRRWARAHRRRRAAPAWATGCAASTCGSLVVGADGQHLAHQAGRMVRAAHAEGEALGQRLVGLRIGRALDEPQQPDAVRDQLGLAAAERAAHEHGRHFAARAGQAARAARTHDAHEAGGALRRGGGQALGDHAAHRRAYYVRPCDAQRVEHAERVERHVLQRVGRVHLQAEAVANGLPHHVAGARVVEALAQADVAVVVAHHAKARVHQLPHEGVGPGHQLHAQAHDEQDDGAALAAGVVDFDLQPVGGDFHPVLGVEVYLNSRSRSHLVATHFSPASTGAPPCRVRVTGSGRS